MNVRGREHLEEVFGAVVRAAAEVVSFEELGREVLPLVRRVVSGSSVHLYRSDADCPMRSLAGDALAELTPDYVAGYLDRDPLQQACRRANPWIWVASRSPEWATYVKTPVHDFCARWGVRYIAHMRLFAGTHLGPGMVGIVLARSPRQEDFSDDDAIRLAQLLPALQAAGRRCERTRRAAQLSGALQGLLEDGRLHPRIALDTGGRLLWASPRAERYLGRGAVLPAELEAAARRVGVLTRPGAPASPPPFEVELRAPDGEVVKGHLQLVRGPGGESYIAVELDAIAPPARGPAPAPRRGAVVERYGLTTAEADVLELLASGMRDREIARRQHTSLSTVRTHVSRVLGKLGVSSRLEAALLYSRVAGPRA